MSESHIGIGQNFEKDDQPNTLDLHVGRRIRLRRAFLGVSEQKLGDLIGISASQIQKYETGTLRAGAVRLFDLARAMDVSISFFFDEMPEQEVANHGVAAISRLGGFAEPQEGFGDGDTMRQEALELIQAFFRITDPAVRERILELIRSLAKE
ncbi:helix-turn-helix domain-containing protein [Granulibacter bethesdensis]|uniref:Transcriptional regulator n=2 Tax=Granulibacter bethesdensis TaxID=364410 RepID=Q0BV61_GRABC|nr:helix-turn-helix transcriptional regulator [Granulibacter bethesdensis]ABI61291.1 Transcriptional regulator [Granulibacter bethesdensis CGDNIH1]AHJ62161.1 Transcriptional regulator [Granulibacter bethesdensis]AHJ64786.1 Transcriptional regulator [Granulibacter bethesdensis CGDNIH4]AHJ67405.1 Transcriptional regulator [Granulibacter bethesdensis]APH51078.1 Transcriptional regulator [Granulibacter bethesdensis]